MRQTTTALYPSPTPLKPQPQVEWVKVVKMVWLGPPGASMLAAEDMCWEQFAPGPAPVLKVRDKGTGSAGPGFLGSR